MGNFEELKKAVQSVIKKNDNQEITGQVLQNTLLSIISAVGKYSALVGVATPGTAPGTPDGNVFYVASKKGKYPNFGNFEVKDQSLIFVNSGGTWRAISTGLSIVEDTDILKVLALKSVGKPFPGIYSTEGSEVVEIPTNYSIVQIEDTKVNEDDVYFVRGYGGVKNRLWAFVKSDGTIISKSDSSLDLSKDGIFITPPKGATRAIFSSYIGDANNFAVTKNGIIKKINYDFASLQNDVNNSKSKIENIERIEKHNNPISFSKENEIVGIYKTEGVKVETVSPVYSVVQIVDEEAKFGDVYNITGYGAGSFRLWAFVDADNNILGKSASGLDTTKQNILIKAPEKTVKAIFSSYTKQPNFCITKNSYSDILLLSISDVPEVKKEIELLNNSNEHISPFAFNSKNWVQAKLDTSGTKVVETAGTWSAVQIIDNSANPGDIYNVTGYGGASYRLWAFVDADNNILDKAQPNEQRQINGVLVKAPVGTVKAIFSAYSNQTNFFVTKNGITNKLLYDFTQAKFNSPLSGKKGYFCGDSIMIGRDNLEAVKSITYFIEKQFGLNCTNVAKGGSVLLYPSYSGNPFSIYWQLQQVPKDADYIIFNGGVNGVNLTHPENPSYSPMGEITSGYESEFNLKTQIGCLEACCKYLQTEYSDKKIGFVITYRISENDYWYKKMVKFKEVLEKWGIPYFDWMQSGINLASIAIREKYGVDSYTIYPEYDASLTYNLDDKVVYQNKTYKANVIISKPEPWNPAHWTLVSSTRYDGWHCNRLAYELLAYKTAKWMETL